MYPRQIAHIIKRYLYRVAANRECVDILCHPYVMYVYTNVLPHIGEDKF